MSFTNIFQKPASSNCFAPLSSRLLRVSEHSDECGPEALYGIYTARFYMGGWQINFSKWMYEEERTPRLHEVGFSLSRHDADKKIKELEQNALAEGWKIDTSHVSLPVRRNLGLRQLPHSSSALAI